ncbi:JAB domain-containing protein [Acinetobacter guerrae]|uniref:JAB domain-containing protein n=1 Tax=Acinetobacter guerrae TaxID=1843371 RepID=A0A3A8EA11_9GAMM|nr:DNA repair protein RadC [Acinetobacter guerrae]RKG31862.1 JAB domain-containing protein [Acinetobacter guerrae]
MNQSIKQSIKAWPQQERPRERLLEQGATSLSDAELLAIFLRSGSKQHSAVELAILLIQHFGGLNPVFDASQEEICQFHGMGATKYSQLMAVKELGRRYLNNYFHQDSLNLDSSQLVLDYLRYELQGEAQEVFAVLCLDSQLRKLHFRKLFFGSTNFCSVSIKQTLRYAIQQHASCIVIAHNHPFGEVQPSTTDIEMTAQLKNACECVEIKLIDHIIIAKHATFSFAEQQLLNL